MRVLLGLLVASVAFGGTVLIQEAGTLTTGSGAPVNGQLSITPTAAFLAADGNQVATTPVVAFVVNGFLNVPLEPNDTGLPALTRYVVVYTLKGGGQYTEIWNVTGSGTKRVSDVRVATGIAPGYVVQPSQIGQGGAATNQVIGWNGLVWGPMSQAGAVGSVFGRTGTVAAASGDYTAAQVTNAVDATGSYSNPAWVAALAWIKLTGVPSTFAPSAHAGSHQNGGPDEVATATPGANLIPKADGTGKLAAGWLPAGLSGSGTANQFTYWTGGSALGSHQYLTNGFAGARTPESPVLRSSDGCGFYTATETDFGLTGTHLIYDCHASTASFQYFDLIDKSNHKISFTSSFGGGWILPTEPGKVLWSSQVDLVTQTSSITPTAIGLSGYENQAVLYRLVSRSGAGTVTLTFKCTDLAGHTQTFTTPTTTGVGQQSGVQYMYCQGDGAATYSTTVVGTISYDVHVTRSLGMP